MHELCPSQAVTVDDLLSSGEKHGRPPVRQSLPLTHTNSKQDAHASCRRQHAWNCFGLVSSQKPKLPSSSQCEWRLASQKGGDRRSCNKERIADLRETFGGGGSKKMKKMANFCSPEGSMAQPLYHMLSLVMALTPPRKGRARADCVH